MPAKRQYNVKGTNDFIVLAAIFFFLCLWAIKDAWFPSEKVLKKHPLQVNAVFQAAGTVEKVDVAEGDTVAKNELLAELRTDRVAAEYDKAKDIYTEVKKTHARLEKEFKDVQTGGSSADALADVQKRLATSQEAMDAALDNVERLRNTLDASELKSPSKGEILKVLVAPHTLARGVTAEVDGIVNEVSTNRICLTDASSNMTEYEVTNTMEPLVTSGDGVSAGDLLAGQKAFVIDPKDHFYLFNKSLTILSFLLFWVFLAIHILAR